MTGTRKVAFLYIKNYTISLSEHVLIEALIQHKFKDLDIIDLSVLLDSNYSNLYNGIKQRIMAADCIYLSNYVARFMVYDIDRPISKIISRKINTAKYLRLLLETVYASDRLIIATTCCFDPMDAFLIDYIDNFCNGGATRYVKKRTDYEQADTHESFPCNFEKLRFVSSKLDSIKIDIELHHCIGSYEFIDVEKFRFRKLVVPGAGYVRRSRAIDSLPTLHKLFTPKCLPVKVALTLANKAFDISSNSSFIRYAYVFANFYHRKMLGTSSVVYTDGSKLDLPIRKFFEIPAAGCLLLCTAFTGMADLGFKDGVTHIECAPEDVGKITRTLDLHSPVVREIIRNGQELVRQKHSASAQAAQLAKALRMAAAGTLKSAHWREGEYIYQ